MVFSSAGPVARLVSARADPLSGQPELKATRARLARVEAHFHGVLLRQDATQLSRVCHWSRVPAERGHIYHLTGLRPVETNAHLRRLATLLLPECPEADVLEMADARRGILRVALVAQSRLLACLFLAPARAQLPRTDALADLLGAPLSASARMNLLAGGQPQADEDTSPRVCACFGVSRAAIRHAVVTSRLRSPAQVGDALKAGTGCGSCVPEIAALIRELSVPA